MRNLNFLRIILLFVMLMMTKIGYNQTCIEAVRISETYNYNFNYSQNQISCENNLGTMYFYFTSKGSGNGTSNNSPAFGIDNTGNFTVSIYGPFNNLNLGCQNLGTPIIQELSFYNSHDFNLYTQNNEIYIIKIINSNCESGTINFNSKFFADETISCENCIPKFNPPVGKYILSAWVKEENAPHTKTSYTTPTIEVNFSSINLTLSFSPNGPIIDGWQKIESVVNITTIGDFEMRLKVSTGEAYFDDIRLFPYDGSMITYVYDPLNLRLVAELDERNYAKIYEYDEEGKLIRIKKETEKGIMTIQETRENSFK